MAIDHKLLDFLEAHLSGRRKMLFKKVIDQRTNYFTVAIQDVYQLHNTSAVIRSCEVFGIQNVHVIEEVNLKKIDREIAMGAQKWVDVNRYNSTTDCLKYLRMKGYKIVAASPHKGTSLSDFDSSTPAALFFGAEKSGISPEVEQNADAFIQIPMYGFTESLNISVSAAIILQNLSSGLRRSNIDWQFSEEEKLEKRLEWAKKNLKKADTLVEKFYEEQNQ